MTRLLFQWIVSIFCILWIGKTLLVPSAVLIFLYDDYMNQSSECAKAMDGSWFSEQVDSNNLRKTSNVQLLVCHSYDKTRKLLLSSGVSDDFLAYLNLKALELDQHSAEELVNQHRFRDR